MEWAKAGMAVAAKRGLAFGRPGPPWAMPAGPGGLRVWKPPKGLLLMAASGLPGLRILVA